MDSIVAIFLFIDFPGLKDRLLLLIGNIVYCRPSMYVQFCRNVLIYIEESRCFCWVWVKIQQNVNLTDIYIFVATATNDLVGSRTSATKRTPVAKTEAETTTEADTTEMTFEPTTERSTVETTTMTIVGAASEAKGTSTKLLLFQTFKDHCTHIVMDIFSFYSVSLYLI